MKHCPDFQEMLWLDVYGELALEERPAWEKHLETCNGCSQEREHLLHLIKNVKEAMPEPSLSPENARTLYNAITGKLMEKQDKTWLQRSFLGGHIRPIHALAAGCLLFIALGWFGLRGLYRPTSVQTISNHGVEEQMIAQDLDILENMELLEEMDTLEKLVQIMDGRDSTI